MCPLRGDGERRAGGPGAAAFAARQAPHETVAGVSAPALHG